MLKWAIYGISLHVCSFLNEEEENLKGARNQQSGAVRQSDVFRLYIELNYAVGG